MASSAKRLTATGDVTTGPTNLLAITAAPTAGGTLTLRDGGVGGEVLATLDLAAGNTHIQVPDDGLRFRGGLHATFGGGLAGGISFWL